MFNDPYDSFFHTQIKSRPFGNESLQFMDKDRLDAINANISKSDKKRSESFKDINRYNLRVVSVAEQSDNILLWSHYADSGRGICVEYDFGSSRLKKLLYPVIYSPMMIDFSELGDPVEYSDQDAQMASLVCGICKDDDWSYEQEWRVVIPNTAPNASPREDFQAPKICRIILGPSFIGSWLQKKNHYINSSINQDDRGLEKIENIFLPFCKFVKQSNIPLYVASIASDRFEYAIEDKIDVEKLETLDDEVLSDYVEPFRLGFY